MAQYDGVIRIVTKIATKDAEESLYSLEYTIKKSAKEIDKLRQKMDALKGQKFYTNDYKKLQSDLKQAEEALSLWNEELRKPQNENAIKAINGRIKETENLIDSIKSKMQSFEKTGKAFTFGEDTAQYKTYEQQIKYEEEAILKAGEHYKQLSKNTDGYAQLSSVASDVLKRIGKDIKKYVTAPFKAVGIIAKNAFIKIGSIAKNIFSNIGKSAKKSENLLSTLGSRFKGLALSLLIFNQISKAFRNMISGMKEGFSNLYDDKNIMGFKKSVDSLKASILTLKNSFAAAFRPIVEIAIPYIQRLIDYMISLMNVISQFMAAITGQKKYTKAIKQTTAAIEEQNKAQKKQLSNLDNLNNLTSDTGAGVDGGAGAMFEEVPLEGKFDWISDWAAQLKELWNNQEWFNIGSHIAEMLNSGLEKLDNWINNKFRPWATEWASRIAQILNGAVSKLDWGLLGKTVADGINSVFATIDRFLIEFDFLELGKGIGTSIKSWFDNIEWDLIGDTFANKWNALIHTIEGIVTTEGIWKSIGDSLGLFIRFWFTGIDYDSIATDIITSINGIFETVKAFIDQDPLEGVPEKITNAINRVIREINWEENGRALGEFFMYLLNNLTQLIEDVEWKKLGQNVGKFLKNAFDTIDFEEIGRAIGEVIQAGIDFLTGLSDYFTVGDLLKAILDALKGAMSVDGFADLAKTLLGLLALKIGLTVTSTMFTIAASTILKALAISLAESGALSACASAIISGITGVFSGLAGLAGAFAKSVLDFLIVGLSTTKKAFVDVGTIIINGISGGLSAAGGIGGLLTADIGSLLASGSLATIGLTIGTAIIGGIIAAIAGWNFGQFLYEKITGEDIKQSFTEQVKEIFSSFTDGSWIEAFKLWGHDIVEGLKEGIIDNFSPTKITTFILTTMFSPFLSIFKSLFGIHSPSTVMAEMGNYIVEGLLNGMKDTWKSVVEWITEKIKWLTDKISGMSNMGGIIGKIASGFTGGGSSKSATFSMSSTNTPYAAHPAIAALSNVEFPAYATGQVIPRTMKQHLAWLGDNDRETEVVSPLSTIEQAVINAMAKVNANNSNNGGGTVTIEIPVVIKGIGEIGRAVQQFDKEFFKQNNRHAFT